MYVSRWLQFGCCLFGIRGAQRSSPNAQLQSDLVLDFDNSNLGVLRDFLLAIDANAINYFNDFRPQSQLRSYANGRVGMQTQSDSGEYDRLKVHKSYFERRSRLGKDNSSSLASSSQDRRSASPAGNDQGSPTKRRQASRSRISRLTPSSSSLRSYDRRRQHQEETNLDQRGGADRNYHEQEDQKSSSSVAYGQKLASNQRLLYRHSYHAGGSADVVKHSILVLLLQYLSKKAKPYVYVDTHAGEGAYSLLSEEANTLMTPAYLMGMSKLREAVSEGVSLPNATLELLRMSDDLGEGYYPGSPMIAALLRREQDSLVLLEREPDTHQILEASLAGHDRTRVLCVKSGYKSVTDREIATPSTRALVFCDPPYQIGGDTEMIAAMVTHLSKHWRSARVAIWYPVTQDYSKTERMIKAVREASRPFDMLDIEMTWADQRGTGMLLVQPPFGIDAELEHRVLPDLAAVLGATGTRVDWIV